MISSWVYFLGKVLKYILACRYKIMPIIHTDFKVWTISKNILDIWVSDNNIFFVHAMVCAIILEWWEYQLIAKSTSLNRQIDTLIHAKNVGSQNAKKWSFTFIDSLELQAER